MPATKKITSIQVVRAGSPPDVDTDFHTAYRDQVRDHCEELYGRGTVSDLVTFSTLAARGAFKTMCTIYSVPFSQANKIAALIPGKVEGKDITFTEIFDPKSPRYVEAADFRSAVAGSDWTRIVDGAEAIEGRVRATGVHACGVIMSSRPLAETIPLQIRQSDQRVVSQWTYKELEAVGLLKFDFLGLDTVDLIMLTVEYIQKNGKTPPNMVELIHGPMNDAKTFAMLSRGETNGIFQLASDGVKDLLRRMKPTELNDIVATTALFRPGPMGMNSHIKYADRKNGREQVEYPVHPEFKGSDLERILAKTYSLVVYQEQVVRIANQIGGMTLQEGDELRSAMGKKKKATMARMKPGFIEGGKNRGFSEAAMQELWSTMETFAEYGFNLAHSVAYAINAYQSAYLKANYPVEFMAALIAQNVGKKDKILAYLQEAKRMRINVGSVDVNISDVRVAPDYTKKSEFAIVYGFSGINAVSTDMAQLIVAEREANGVFTSVQNMVNRCSKRGVNNRKIYENIALAGGFDSFGFTRKSIVESLSSMLNEAKTQSNKGATLFDMMGSGAVADASTELSRQDEYAHLEKLTKESNVIGLYLTSHPLANAGSLAGLRTMSIDKALKTNSQITVKLVGSLTEAVIKRQKNGGKSIAVVIDDGSASLTAFLNRNLVKGLDRRVAQQRVQALYEKGAYSIPAEIEALALAEEFTPVEELEIGQIYSIDVVIRPGQDGAPYGARIASMIKVDLADDGSLPVRIRLPRPRTKAEKQEQNNFLRTLARDFPGASPVYLTYREGVPTANYESQILDALDHIRMLDQPETVEEHREVAETSLTGTVTKQEKIEMSAQRNWPPPRQDRGPILLENQYVDLPWSELTYRATELRVAKTNELAHAIEYRYGIENYDFGVFNAAILADN